MGQMPRISMFFGIVIYMYYEEKMVGRSGPMRSLGEVKHMVQDFELNRDQNQKGVF